MLDYIFCNLTHTWYLVTVRNCTASAVTTVSFSDGDVDKIKSCKHFSIQVTSEFWGLHGCVVRCFALLGCDPSRSIRPNSLTYKKKKILRLVVQTRAIRAAARFSAVSRCYMFFMPVSEGHSLVKYRLTFVRRGFGNVFMFLWSSGQSFWLQIQRSRVRFPALPDFLSSSGSGTGSTQPREVN